MSGFIVLQTVFAKVSLSLQSVIPRTLRASEA